MSAPDLLLDPEFAALPEREQERVLARQEIMERLAANLAASRRGSLRQVLRAFYRVFPDTETLVSFHAARRLFPRWQVEGWRALVNQRRGPRKEVA